MANYRRAFIENSYVFLTIVTFNRRPILISHIDLLNLDPASSRNRKWKFFRKFAEKFAEFRLKESFRHSQQFFDYQIIGLVILPEHFHMIIKPKINHEYPRIIM